jgi:hypothetical protein
MHNVCMYIYMLYIYTYVIYVYIYVIYVYIRDDIIGLYYICYIYIFSIISNNINDITLVLQNPSEKVIGAVGTTDIIIQVQNDV